MHKYTKKELMTLITGKLRRNFGRDVEEATSLHMFKACALVLRDIMSERQMKTADRVAVEHLRQVHYLSLEFLMGRSLMKNAYNLGVAEPLKQAIEGLGFSAPDLFEAEPDAGLGNGGLGRLAACYLDSMTLEIPATGYSICYELGIFKQKIVDGQQVELPDNWLGLGDAWLIPKMDETEEVRFGGKVEDEWDALGRHRVKHTGYDVVLAVPKDMEIAGYGTEHGNLLRLWDANSPTPVDMNLFSSGQYLKAVEQRAMAESISKVLYPEDNHYEGKSLRLKQQYFFVSATIQSIVRKHRAEYGTLRNFHLKHVIQINDTHPTLAIPEMMRILLDECGFGWDKAFDICQKVFSYTNHTVMAEALEKWNVDIFKMTLPRIYQIVVEMDRRAREELAKAFPGDQGKIDYMALIGDNQVRMANICAYTANSINGVSKLHSEIIKDSVFHDYYLFKPKAFKNVTNGIAYRRWLLASNPELCKLLDETIGDGYKHDASDLTKLNKYENDKTVLKRLNEIKLANKQNFANYLAKSTGQVIDPGSIFDCQVKRMHEYKRQHLNALNIAAQYLYLKENPNANFIPKTYIFGAKAAPGYYMAKQMIRMICKLGDLINNDPAVRDKLRVVYLEEYCVSLSEHLMPAAEVSEQISLAGTEASGTGNMKFMLNGAITLGTLDGANVEIADAAGKENELIFGMLTPEVNNLKQVGYHPNAFITGDDVANYTLNFLERGWNGESFHEVTENLRTSDPYMVMADFKDYRRAQADLQKLYGDREKWAQMSLKNTANSGIFSADRAVLDYARDIWHASTVPMGK